MDDNNLDDSAKKEKESERNEKNEHKEEGERGKLGNEADIVDLTGTTPGPLGAETNGKRPSDKPGEHKRPRESSDSEEESWSNKSRKKAKRKSAKGTRDKFLSFPEFGDFPPAQQLREWDKWVELVVAAMSFARGYTEVQQHAYFRLYCGQPL